MTHDEAFLEEIAAHAEDDTYRLIYADWLDDHGDPERAEFIRVQCTLARNSDSHGTLPPAEIARLEARERSLLSRHGSRWLQPLRDLGASGRMHSEFWRGFVEEVVIDAGAFIERGDELWRSSPVISLGLNKVGRQASRLANCPHLARVRNLSFEGAASISKAGLRTVMTSPHLTALEALSVQNVALTDDDIAALASLPNLSSLSRLSLGENIITGRTLPRLVGRLPRLASLSLTFCRTFDPATFGEALAAMNPASLRTLSFYGTPLQAVGMRALATNRKFTGLRELWLRFCGFDAPAMEALASATHLNAVTKLYLMDPLTSAGGIALAEWPGLRSLETLNLDGTMIGAEGGEALARSPHLGRLTELQLRRNHIGDAALELLVEREELSRLEQLQLTENALTERATRALAASPVLGRLRHLDLDENLLGDEGITPLLEAELLRGLRWISLSECGVSQGAVRELLRRFPELRCLCTDAAFLHGEHLETLREEAGAWGTEDEINAAVQDRLAQAILDDPNDEKARDIYASHLRDVSSPWWVTMSLQSTEEGFPAEVRQRWQEWFNTGLATWIQPLQPWVAPLRGLDSFHRGLLRHVHFTEPLPREVACTLARFPPLALLPLEVQAGNMTGEGAFQILAESPCLARMKRLDFRSLRANDLRHVLASPHLTALQELTFGPCHLGDDVARLLAESPALAHLCRLDFGCAPGTAGNHLGPAGLAALGASPHLGQLRSLGLAGNASVGDRGVEVLVNTPLFAHLSELDLTSAGLTDAGLRSLASSRGAASLQTLRAGGSNDLTDEAILALAASPHLHRLYELDLQGSPGKAATPLSLTDRAATVLVESKALPSLRVVRVSRWAGLTETGRAALRDRFRSGLQESPE